MKKPTKGREKPKKAKHSVPLMTDEAMRDFVLGYCDGTITTNRDVKNPQHVGLVFLPLAFGALADWTKKQTQEIGLIYADRRQDASTGTAMNGIPVFMACRLMHKTDWARAVVAINKEMERRKNIEV